MDSFFILAQVEELAIDPTVLLTWIWAHITELGLVESLTFIAFGSVCLFYGWRVFKILVVISFAVLGLIGGMVINNKIGVTTNPLLVILSCIACGIVAIPLMRWAVCVLGAIAGGLLTSGLWYTAQLPNQYMWAGAITGVVAGGMMSFIVFRIAVMLFSSLGGAALMAAGVLALLYLYPETTSQVHQLFFEEKWFLPIIVLAPMVIGIYLQNKFVNASADWTV